MSRIVALACLSIAVAALGVGSACAGDVSGKVVMPDVCSPGVSPAVVILEPLGTKVRTGSASAADIALVNQKGLQFVPRVQAIALGQTIRFTNDDSETHNVHVLSPGNEYNQSMAAGERREFTPVKAGVVRLTCDIHPHMRGYVIVSASPWVRVCSADGQFRLRDVPAGRYRLSVWHEMGKPLKREVTVGPGKDLDLAILALDGPKFVAPASGRVAPARPWADVIDRIGQLMTASQGAAAQPDGFKLARKHAQDAYFAEFEGSEMETAIRLHLGVGRFAALERRFRALVPALREASEGRRGPAAEAARELMLALVNAARELNAKGVTDSANLRLGTSGGGGSSALVDAAGPTGDRTAQLAALRAGFDRVRKLADHGDGDEAAAEMSAVYFDEFEPVERFVAVHQPQDVRPLEERFGLIRGEVGAGLLKGEALAARLVALDAEVTAALQRGEAQVPGSFGPAFGASFVTALREGAEVILLLTMLVALAAKTGQRAALRAIAWGVVLAVVASAATAVGLNLMVASAKGRTQELVEGTVMLAAAGVLFYVSYWLISQSESKRWMAFLKRQATRGAAPGGGGRWALLATAFVAVYREGAETALMYQAMIGSQGGSSAGLTGLAVGLVSGLVVLAAGALFIRATSVRIPLRAFFQVTGAILFAMAVVFAGNGVAELQASRVLKTTPLTWLGEGLPVLGIHPTLQALSVQGLLLAGAALALIVMAFGDPAETPAPKRPSGAVESVGIGA